MAQRPVTSRRAAVENGLYSRAATAFNPGDRLGSYEILALIGAGGMGEVYRARDPRLGRDVAIKVLHEDVACDPERLARFDREARAVAALSHPNILSIFDIGNEGGVAFAVMELLEGETLRETLSSFSSARGAPPPLAAAPRLADSRVAAAAGASGLPARRVVEIGTQVAHGLAAAHDKGLVHRDLKPENVFVTTDGRVKILDFGLARTIPLAASSDGATVLGSEHGTTPGLVVGTIGYMAPEQVRAEAVDARTDIFAFGALLYELLTGDRPFRGATAADTLSAILKEDPAEARTSRGALPPALERLVRRCLEKIPARRFQSAHDLAFALEQALGSSSGSTLAPSGIAASPKPATGRSAARQYVLLALAAIGLVAAGVLIDRLWRPAASAALQPTFAALTIDSGIESWPSLSPDGTTLLYVSRATGHDDIWRRDVDGRNAINLTAEFSDGSTMPAFSPDGRRIAFRSERKGGGLFVMGATGENPQRVSGEGYNPAWSHDGTLLAYATEETTTPNSRIGTSEIWVVNLDSPSQDKRKISDVDAMQPSWSPDGRHLVVWSTDGGTRLLKVIAVADGSAAPVFPSDPDTTYWNPVWSWDGRWLYFVSNASGSMTVGRVPVDARGRPTGSRETITVPASFAGQISLSRDGQRFAYQAQSGRYSLSRAPFDATRGEAGASTPILEGALRVNFPSVSPNGSTIAFSGDDDIFTIDRDGRHLQQLTRDAARDRGSEWTPDGKRIAFYSNRQGPYEIWSMNPDGSDQRVVASAPNKADWTFPKFSGDGPLSVVSAGGSPALLDASTSPATLTETLPAIDGGDLFWPYAWSPDRSRLAGLAQSNTKGRLAPDVILYDPATHRYVDRIAGVGSPVAWLPDGKRLIVGTDRYYVLDVATQKRTLLGPWPTLLGGSFGAALADDGRTFYFASATTDADIWMMTLGPAPQPRVK